MKRYCQIIFIILLSAQAAGQAQDTTGSAIDTLANLRGDYLGQTPPGLKPVLFAPEIVSTNLLEERDITITPDLKELYFTRDEKIMVMKQTDQGWTAPAAASFSSEHPEAEPYVAPGGGRLYFVSQRPTGDENEDGFYHIWFVERQDGEWGAPKIFANRRDYYPTMTTDGFMYLTDAGNDLFRVRVTDEAISDPEKLSDSINTARAEYNCFVAPDESYLIFTSWGWGTGFGGGDLYISFKKEDGIWAKAKNMGGGVNSNGHDYCPSVSPDGKYFFFTSTKGGSEDIYWVDAGIIERLKTEDLNTSDMLFSAVMLNNTEVGRFKYGQLQKQFGECCIFDGRLLVAVGDRLMDAGRPEDAVTMMKLGAELHPETLTIGQRLKLALLSADQGLYDDVARQLKEHAAELGGRQEIQLNGLGYRLIFWRRLDDALKVLKLNVELFPNSFNVYDSYGEALMYFGDTANSILNYQKSLELNPDNANAVEIIKRLKGE